MKNETNSSRGVLKCIRCVAIVLGAAAVTSACSRPNDTRAVEIRNNRYAFPSHEVEAVVADQGHLFVRVRPHTGPFQLLFNTRSDRAQVKTGKLVISGVSDQFGTFDYEPSAVGTIVCNQAPNWNCGFEVMDGDARWSVVFDRELIPQAEALRSKALQALHGYRRTL